MTRLDRGLSADDQTRAEVIAYLDRTGNADLIEILGLAVDAGPAVCPACKKRPPRSGVCRRLAACRQLREAAR
jgi:hypothetical protein